jgi:hypothetical protein
MRKAIILFIAAILVIAPTKFTYSDTILYTQAKSNLRAGPSTKHKIVKVLSIGESVRVGRLSGDWYEVLNSKREVVGYIYAGLVRSEAPKPSSIVGKWRGDIPGLGMGKFEQYTLIKDGSKYYVLRKYYDGSQRKNILILKNTGGEMRYYKKEKAYVEYYVIHGNGDLGLYDKLGLIRTITRMAGS